MYNLNLFCLIQSFSGFRPSSWLSSESDCFHDFSWKVGFGLFVIIIVHTLMTYLYLLGLLTFTIEIISWEYLKIFGWPRKCTVRNGSFECIIKYPKTVHTWMNFAILHASTKISIFVMLNKIQSLAMLQ